VSFFGMAGLMGFTPFAMADRDFGTDASSLVVEAHMLAMYAPSLLTGHVLRVIGVPAMLLLCRMTQLAGNSRSTRARSTRARCAWRVLGHHDPHRDGLEPVLRGRICAGHLPPAERFAAQGTFEMATLLALAVALATSGTTYAAEGLRGMFQVRTLAQGVVRGTSVLTAYRAQIYLAFHCSLVVTACVIAVLLHRCARAEAQDSESEGNMARSVHDACKPPATNQP